MNCKVKTPTQLGFSQENMIENATSTGLVPLPRKILVTVDGSEESQAAARYAIEVAVRLRAELAALHVILVPEYISEEVSNRLKKDLASRGELALSRVREATRDKGITFHSKMVTTTRSVVTTICEFAADEGAGLIVLGKRGAGGVAEMMLGTVAAGVVREARCPVLVVR